MLSALASQTEALSLGRGAVHDEPARDADSYVFSRMRRCIVGSLPPMNARLSAWTWLLFVVSLSGCGGGGSDDAAAAAPTAPAPAPAPATPSPAPAPTPSPAPAPTPASASTCNIANFSATALARINQLRAAGADCRTGGQFAPAGALAWNGLLTQAAQGHTQDMVTANFFSHTGSGGSTLTSRVNATGYLWSALGENIAAGYSGIDAVMAGWMASDGHCANLMNSNFTEVGLVCINGTSANTYGNYWTMDLGKSR